MRNDMEIDTTKGKKILIHAGKAFARINICSGSTQCCLVG